MTDTDRIAVAVLLLSIIVTALIYTHGASGRSFMPTGLGALVVASPEEAPLIWERAGVRGRVLLLFDRTPHLFGHAHHKGAPGLSASTFIEYSLFHNLVRSIYLVLPESERDNLLTRPEVKSLRQTGDTSGNIYLYNLIGVPLILTTLASVPCMTEPPLVYINEALFNSESVRELLSMKGIVSDCIVIYRGAGR